MADAIQEEPLYAGNCVQWLFLLFCDGGMVSF